MADFNPLPITCSQLLQLFPQYLYLKVSTICPLSFKHFEPFKLWTTDSFSVHTQRCNAIWRVMCWIMMVKGAKFCPAVHSSVADVDALAWSLLAESQLQLALCHCTLSPAARMLITETVQACTNILLCVRDSMAVHLPPQQICSKSLLCHCNRIVGRFLLQCCSMYTASLETDGNRSRHRSKSCLSFLPVVYIINKSAEHYHLQ